MKKNHNEVVIPLEKVHPNRLNPNEMGFQKQLVLRIAIERDDYDAIIVSPLRTFYDEVSLEEGYLETESGAEVRLSSLPEDHYVICDGQHRYQEAVKQDKPSMRCEIWNIAESEAMAYFYKRHASRGSHDPVKEAILFKHEMDKGFLYKDIVEKYNLTGTEYIRSRLRILNVASNVIPFYYETPEGSKGDITLTHLRHLATLPRRLQLPVAKMCLLRGWTTKQLESKCDAIRAGNSKDLVLELSAKANRLEEQRKLIQKQSKEIIEDAEILSDDEALKDFPDEIKEVDNEVKTLKETYPTRNVAQEAVETARAREELLEAKSSEMTDTKKALPVDWIKKKEEAVAPKRRLTMRDFTEFTDKVMQIAFQEGMNLLEEEAEAKIKESLDLAVFNALDNNINTALPIVVLRAIQLHIIWKMKDP